MDGCTGKKTTGGGIARRGSVSSFKDVKHEEDRSSRCANRIGCNTRQKSMKGTQIGNPNMDKDKFLRPPFCSSSSNFGPGSSSKRHAARCNLQKPLREQQNRASLKETVLPESSSRHGVAGFSESSHLTTEPPAGHPQNGRQKISVNIEEVAGSSDVGSGAKKQVDKRSGLHSQDASLGSSASARRSFLSGNTGQDAKSLSPSQGSKVHRDGLRNDRPALVSGFHHSGKTSPDSGNGRMVNTMKKRCPDGKSSSSKTKVMTRLPTRGNSISQRSYAFSRPSIAFHEGSSSQQASGKSKNCSTASDVGAMVRTQSPFIVDTRTRVPTRANNNLSSLTQPIMPHELLHTEVLVSESTPSSSSQSFPTEFRSNFQNSYGQRDSSSETVYRSPISRSEGSSTHAFHGHSVYRDSFRRISMDGVAEALFALERIEQDAELTSEQLLALETNLLLGGLSFHDQHRDMRLDIDNMTYEELLALEEKMGTVSTALTEEALSKCLKRSRYMHAALFPILADSGEDDTKCSICQEEYVAGDELGTLGCEHGFHVDCIHQWLRLKNWCPVCKAAASPS